MKIDCRDLECPKPVVMAKKALEGFEEGILEVVLNNKASVENVSRFAASQGYYVDVEEKQSETILSITKGFGCEVADGSSQGSSQEKVLFLKSDKIGEGELGAKLMLGFLQNISELEKKPKKIFCVNDAVRLTCENTQAIEALKALDGVEVYSCGVCVEHLGLELKVGKIGNAYDVLSNIFGDYGVISL